MAATGSTFTMENVGTPEGASATSAQPQGGGPIGFGTFGMDNVASSAQPTQPKPPVTLPANFNPAVLAYPLYKDPTTPLPVPPGAKTGAVANIGAGSGERVLNLAGGPVDLATAGINAASRGINAATGSKIGPITNPALGSDWLKSLFGYVGADPRTIAPADEGEAMLRGAGGGVGTAVTMATGAGALGRAVPWLTEGIPGAVQQSIVQGGKGTVPLTAAGVGGGTGQVVSSVLPEQYKPLGEFAGNLFGGAAVLGSVAGTQALLDSGPGGFSWLRPFTKAGQETAAVQRVKGAATDWPSVWDMLTRLYGPGTLAGSHEVSDTGEVIPSPGAMPGELFQPATPNAPNAPPGTPSPRSVPTTAELTGDPGLAELTRGVAAKNSAVFKDLIDRQNAARAQALDQMTPANADPHAVSGLMQRQLQELDAAANQRIDDARAAAQQATERLGGAQTGTDSQTALQVMGSNIRGKLNELDLAEKARVSRMYQDVDPDGTLQVNMSPVRDGAQQILGSIPANAAPLEGEVRAIFDTASRLPDTQVFGEAAALRSRITDASRAARYTGNSQTERLLVQLRQRLDGALGATTEEGVARDAANVNAGTKTPEDTIVGRQKQAAANDNPYAGTANENVPGGQRPGPLREGAGVPPGAGDTQPPGVSRPGQAPPIPEQPGAAGAAAGAGGGPGTGPGGGAVPPPPPDGGAAGVEPPPVLDAEALQRYQAANAAHRERIETFHDAPGVGDVLAPGARPGEWRLGDSQVAGKIFNAGPGAAERIQAFMTAGGDRADLVADMRDYAAYSLRQAAERADGTLDPARAARWLQRNSEAMSQFPELRQSFENATAMSRTLDETAAAHAEARSQFETSSAQRYLQGKDPVKTMQRLLTADDGEGQIGELMQRTALDPAARNGLQRAATTVLTNIYKAGNAPQQLQNFVTQATPALRRLFSPDQWDRLQTIIADMQRTQRMTGKLPGGSNTAQDTAAGLKAEHGGHPDGLGMLLAAEVGGEISEPLLHGLFSHIVGSTLGAPVARVFGMVAPKVINVLTRNGLTKIDDIFNQMIKDPQVAYALTSRVDGRNAAANWALLQQRLSALNTNAALQSQQKGVPLPPPPRNPLAGLRNAPPVREGVQ